MAVDSVQSGRVLLGKQARVYEKKVFFWGGGPTCSMPVNSVQKSLSSWLMSGRTYEWNSASIWPVRRFRHDTGNSVISAP